MVMIDDGSGGEKVRREISVDEWQWWWWSEERGGEERERE
jgi:hypothetical protein